MARDAHEHIRFGSIRAYRRVIDRALAMHAAGKMTSADVTATISAAKTGAELFMAEHTLASAGMDKEAQHDMGIDGGTTMPRDTYSRRKKVTVERGVNKNGDPVDTVKVTLEGTDADPGLEDDAELETLK